MIYSYTLKSEDPVVDCLQSPLPFFLPLCSLYFSLSPFHANLFSGSIMLMMNRGQQLTIRPPVPEPGGSRGSPALLCQLLPELWEALLRSNVKAALPFRWSSIILRTAPLNGHSVSDDENNGKDKNLFLKSYLAKTFSVLGRRT